MPDSKVTSNGNVTVRLVPAAGLADYRAPTADEINVGVDLNDAIALDTFDLAADEAHVVEDRCPLVFGNAPTRAFQQFAASFSMFRFLTPPETTSPYVQAFETFRTPRQHASLITRVLQAPSGEPSPAEPGQCVSVFRFMSDAVGDDTEGEDSVKLTVEFLPQGQISVYTKVATEDPIVVSGEGNLETGDVTALKAHLNGEDVTGWVTWTSSDYDVATVSPNGVVRGGVPGSATITASHLAAGEEGTITVEVGGQGN